MAEQEVIKHTKKIFSVWGEKKSFWHKLREFVLEILIIVFAITLSIYLHDRSVKKHQDHETKEFLLGLKEDLKTDIAEMDSDRVSYLKSGLAFAYIANRKINELPDPDTLEKYRNWILNTTGLIPNSGRFEGFKSSGKIGTIDNKELQNNIMDLYQEDIPNVIVSTNSYTQKKQRLFDYLATNRKRITDSTDNFATVMGSDHAHNISKNLSYVGEIIQRYDTCISKMKAIIKGIEEEYGK
ncbi:MAG TPA: DUF6090 family protein [Chitinophagaceae bacterium]|jgi:hypothetical protein|nr:DUF6090 family protein [Chitinophagaceae bacterium]